MLNRCGWAGSEPIYTDYHDIEWGVPEWDSRALWEKLILDGFQAGLSWITILKKRNNFRAAFVNFDPVKIATWGEVDIEHLLQNEGIIRHRGKIQATIGNAQAYLKVNNFSELCWSYVDGKPLQANHTTSAEVPVYTDMSTRFSKDLKNMGFKYCGPTIVYAWMQACGLINDHLKTCPRHEPCRYLGSPPR